MKRSYPNFGYDAAAFAASSAAAYAAKKFKQTISAPGVPPPKQRYKNMRRKFIKSGTNTNVRPGLFAGGVSGPTFTESHGTIKMRKKTLTKLQKILIKEKAREQYVISRWQKLTPLAYDPASTKLGFELRKIWSSATQGAGGAMYLPCYLFNLTSSPVTDRINNATQWGYSYPMYRLFKYVRANAAADATARNYDFAVQAGQTNDGSTSTNTYIVEKNITGGATSDTTSVKMTDHFIHEWSNVGITLKNTGNTVPKRVHIATVQFRNRYASPLRRYTNTAGTINSTIDTDDATQYTTQADLWWDHFFANKVTNPLRSSIPMRAGKDVVFKTYECICLEPGSSYPTHTYKKFIRNGSMYNCVNPDAAEAAHDYQLNTMTTNVDNYNVMATTDANRITPFPRREKDTWLMIWADDFSAIDNYDDTLNNTLTFDIVVRSKHTFNSN